MADRSDQKLPYHTPTFHSYGTLPELTAADVTPGNDGAGGYPGGGSLSGSSA